MEKENIAATLQTEAHRLDYNEERVIFILVKAKRKCGLLSILFAMLLCSSGDIDRL